MKLTILLCLFVCANVLKAKIDESAAAKLQSTAQKIRTAKFFYSDEQIKHKIKRSMQDDTEKWKKARSDYKEVVRMLKELNVDVNVPDTLDELLMDRVDKDADKILIYLAKQVKQHLHS